MSHERAMNETEKTLVHEFLLVTMVLTKFHSMTDTYSTMTTRPVIQRADTAQQMSLVCLVQGL